MVTSEASSLQSMRRKDRCIYGSQDEPGLNMFTSVSGFPEISGSSPPTTMALAPNRCASLALETNWQVPRCTRAIQGSKRSGMFGSTLHSRGHPRLGWSMEEVTVSFEQETVNELRGMT